MGFPESFVGTGVLDCPFRIPPTEGVLPIYRIQRLPCGKDFASEFEFALQMSSSCHRR